MTKKLMALLLAASMMVAAGCRSAAPAAPAAPSASGEATSTASGQPTDATASTPATDVGNYKIAIYTGTVSQGEEEFQQAVNMQKKYGADKIVTATYPDNFSTETETVISGAVALASDPEVKAIIFVQAVPGAAAAIDKVRETRPDMLFILGVPAEDPAVVSGKADLIMLVDEISMGSTIPAQAKKQGAKTFIHYSFARHLSYATISARHDLMKKTCEEIGIQFVDVNAPDPTGDAGVAGAQQFILEDVPRQIQQYGKDTAFFATNCGMQEPLIRSVLEQGAILPQQCCPSPYHAYPAALSIGVAGHEGDVPYMLEQIAQKVSEGGNTGRMSTWPIPVNMMMVQAGVEYAIEFAEGRTNGRHDDAKFREILDRIAKEAGTTTTVSLFKDEKAGDLKNFYMILCDFVDF